VCIQNNGLLRLGFEAIPFREPESQLNLCIAGLNNTYVQMIMGAQLLSTMMLGLGVIQCEQRWRLVAGESMPHLERPA
jgi:hypothetical protein